MITHSIRGARVAILLLALGTCTTLAPPSRAEEPASANLQMLLDRLQKLEQRNDELEKNVRDLKEQLGESAVRQEKAETPEGKTDDGALDRNVVRKLIADYIEQNPPKARVGEGKAADSGPKRFEVGKNLDVKASWKDGVWAETSDKAFTFHVGGRIDFDTTWYSAPHSMNQSIAQFNNYFDANQGLQDGFDVRRFRLRVDGTLWEQFDYRAEAEFAGALDLRRRTLGISPTPPASGAAFDQELAPAVRMTDVFIEYKDMPYLGTLRAGHQREILSFANGSSDNFQPFMERPLIFNAFNNDFQFDNGLAFYRTYLCDRLYSWVGLFRPNDFNSNDNRDGGVSIGDGKYAFDARLTALPVWMDNGREWLMFGVAYSQRALPFNQTRFRAQPEVQSASSGFLVPNIVNTGTILSGDNEQIFNIEIASAWGPLTLTSEWSAAKATNTFTSTGSQVLSPTNATAAQLRALGYTPRGTYYAQGYYVEALYFLTGEYRPLRLNQPAYDRVAVHEKAFWTKGPLGSIFGKGAWEVGVRYDYIDLSNSGINGGLAHAVTGGLNWYLNDNTRIQWNYIWMNRNFEPTDFAGRREGDFQGFGIRFHVDF
ncbi:MAG: OprO/OprP family phosphate-selective porin [Gemmataceae bacterium]|nr:OprO/OprP family phosphate-selective porin [Gemmataceae bacterium]